jgi:hypothetical protein
MNIASRNEFVQALLADQDFLRGLSGKLGAGLADLVKADTISQATGFNWYDLRPVVQLLYPYKELIPLISRLPRVNGDGGTGYHWKRITGINVNTLSFGVGEGQRGARIAITEEDQQATYKTLGLESSVTFQAGWASGQLSPNNRAIATQATLRSVMIGEEQSLILGNSSLALGNTPTPTLTKDSASTSSFSSGTVYVIAVALSGFGYLNTTAYSSGAGGVPGQVTKTNADGSTNTFGGGSAKPSTEASISVSSGNNVTATVTPVAGAVAYAWYVGTTSGAETLAAITSANRATFTKAGALGQPITDLQVSSAYVDNSTNAYLPDGIISMINGSVFGSSPGTAMATVPTLPDSRLSIASSGSLVLTAPAGNSGLTISGTNIAEFDLLLQAAYDQYKIGFDKILMSSADLANFAGTFFGSGDTAAAFRIVFDAEAASGRIVAGRRVTSYLNKFFGNTLDIEIHPYLPQGTILFWSDRVPYELSGVANILEAHVRQDYYEVQWPWSTMRHEFGVYVDEVFAGYFMPAFAAITNLNPPAGAPVF